MFRLGRKINFKDAFTLTELAFIALIIAICILLLTPFINKIKARAKIITCEENLQKISFALNLYAGEHQDKFPSNLAELAEGGYVEDEKVFDCPSSLQIGDSQEPDYHYTSGYVISAPSDTVMVFDKDENHKKVKHVLYISGDIIRQKK